MAAHTFFVRGVGWRTPEASDGESLGAEGQGGGGINKGAQQKICSWLLCACGKFIGSFFDAPFFQQKR